MRLDWTAAKRPVRGITPESKNGACNDPPERFGSLLLGVVIHTDPAHARLLADHANPVVQAFYGALGTVCPDLGTDRVVAHE